MRRGRTPSAIRENRVSEREFREGDFAAAEEGGGERAELRTNAGEVAKLNDGLNPNRHPDPDCGAVFRFHQRLARSHRSFVTVILGFRSPFTENPSRAADHDGTIIQG